MIIWLYGRPCSGKTTIATALRERLEADRKTVLSLDGDVVRRSLSSDLGFEPSDRLENVRRIASVAKLIHSEIGANVDFLIVSSIAPLKQHRDLIMSILEDVVLIYLDSSLEACVGRDVKGFYRAKAIGIEEFEESNGATVPTEGISIEESTELIIEKLWTQN